jgi:hypothetical protein
MPIAYFEEYKPAYAAGELEVSYKNFRIRKKPEMNLYSIIIPEGKELHKSLAGEWTKLELIKSVIDQFLTEHGTIYAAFSDLPEPKRGRGRPKKVSTPIEELLKTSDEDNRNTAL